MILVQKEHLSYKYINIYQDETAMTVRILMPVINAERDGGYKNLMSHNKLLRLRFSVKDQGYDTFIVVAEGRYDRTTECGREWWSLGEQIDFFYDIVDINKGVVQCAPIDRLAVNGETKLQYLKRMGKQLVATIFCNNTSDNILTSNTLVVADVDGFVITNRDLKNQYMYNEIERIIQDNTLNVKCVRNKFCTPNQSTTITIKVANNPNAEGVLYAHSDSGYISNGEVIINSGEGVVHAVPLLLQPNESLIVSVGTKNKTLVKTAIPVVKTSLSV